MTEQFPSTERKTYKLFIKDGDVKKTIFLTDDEAASYIVDKKKRSSSFFHGTDEYPMRDCLLKKAEEKNSGETMTIYDSLHFRPQYIKIDDEEILVEWRITISKKAKETYSFGEDGVPKDCISAERVYLKDGKYHNLLG